MCFTCKQILFQTFKLHMSKKPFLDSFGSIAFPDIVRFLPYNIISEYLMSLDICSTNKFFQSMQFYFKNLESTFTK